MSSIALQLERVNGGRIDAGSNVIFEPAVTASGNIHYDSDTGVITILEPGSYEFDWWISLRSCASLKAGDFTLLTSQGNSIIGSPPDQTNEIMGVAILDILSVPTTVELKNSSANALFYQDSVPVTASMAVIGETNDTQAYGSFVWDGRAGETSDSHKNRIRSIGEYSNLVLNPGSSDITILIPGVYRLEFAVNAAAATQKGQGSSLLVNGVPIALGEHDGFSEKEGTQAFSAEKGISFFHLNAGDRVSLGIGNGNVSALGAFGISGGSLCIMRLP